jgi:hypothetical protein
MVRIARSKRTPSTLAKALLPASTRILVRLLQYSNAESPIAVTDEGMLMLVRLLQRINALSPIVVTDEGILYEPFLPPGYAIMVRIARSKRTPSTLAKALLPASTRILVKLLHKANAASPIAVTEEGILILVRLLQRANALFPIVVTEEGMLILVRLLQSSNAAYPIVVTEEGMLILVSPLQEPNAAYPIVVTEEGMLILVSPLQR